MGKRLLAVMLSLLLSIGTLSPAYSKAYSNSEGAYNGFNYYWANQLLNEWIVNNNIAEDDSRVIYPNTEIARGELIVLLEDVFECLDGNKERIYYNLPSDWWVDEHDVIDKNDILLPTEPISREDASELLCDIFGLSADLSEVNIPDMSSVSAQNKAAVKVMVQTGYLKLYPDGWFHPEQNVTVSQVARAINFISMYLYHNDKLVNLKTSPLGSNLISNGGFDQPLSSAIPDSLGNVDTENSWIFFTNNGGDGTCIIDDGMARVDVTNNVGVPDYGVQLIQAPVTLKKGDVYKIIFDAKSTEARNFSIKMGSTGDKGWLAYNSTQAVQIDDTLRTYSMEFTMAQPDDANARIELFFAASNAPVWVDNIRLYKVNHIDLITLDDLLNRTNTEADEDLVEDWKLVWHDEFDGTQLNTDYWNYDVGWGPFDNGWGNYEKEYYVPENVSVENGNLVIKITEEERTVYEANGNPFTTNYSSGRINTKGKVTPQYGRVEVRAKLLTGDALWPAVWMIGDEWPDQNSWPEVGEIDIVELLGQEPNKIYGTVHSPLSYQNWFAGEGQTYVLNQGTFADAFHDYVIEWDEDEIEYYIDGILFHIINKDEITYKYGPGNWAFDHEFYLVANLAAGGFFPGAPNENTIVPNQMEIDYIRIYEDVNPAVVTEEVVDCANELPEPIQGIDQFANGTFDANLDSWGTYIHYDAAANISVENGEAKIGVDNEGNELWSIQLCQGPFKLDQAKTYSVSFDARADVARKLQVIIENGEYVTFLNDAVDLTNTMNHYTLTFTMPSSEEASLKFMAGKVQELIGLPHNVYIDNVQFVESQAPVKAITELAYGTFDGTLGPWNQYIHYDALATMSVDNNEFKAAIANQGAEFWGVQLYQGVFSAYAGKQYTVEFDARSDIDRDIQVMVDNTNYNAYLSEIVSLNGTMSTYKCTFTMPGDDMVSLKFLLGNVNGSIAPHNVYLDNIRVYEEVQEKAITELANGTFDSTLSPWNQYIHYDALATMSVENNEFKAAIDNQGFESWGVQLYQGPFAVYAGKQYTLEFNARSDIDRDIQVIVDNTNYNAYLSQTVSINGTMSTYKCTFTMPGDDIVSLKFLLGNVNGSIAPHNVYLDNIRVYEEAPVSVPSVPN